MDLMCFVIVIQLQKEVFSPLGYLDGLQYVVIKVREARVLVHHAVYELSELQQERFASGKPICP